MVYKTGYNSIVKNRKRLVNDPIFANALCYIFAFFFGIYPVSRRFPGLSIGFFTLGGIALIFFSPLLLRGKKLRLYNPLIFNGFYFFQLFFCLINPDKYSFVLLFKVTSVYVFYIVITNLDIPIEVYKKMIWIAVGVSAVIIITLLITHKVIYKTQILTPYLIPRGVRHHVNQLAFFVSMVFCIVYSHFCYQPKWMTGFLCLIFFYAVYLTYSRMGLFCMLMAVLLNAIIPHHSKPSKNSNLFKKFFLKLGTGKIIVLLIALFSLIFFENVQRFIDNVLEQRRIESIIDTDSRGDSRRQAFITMGLKESFINPFGHGLESFRRDHEEFVSHNDYVMIFYETGFIGLFLFVGIFIHFFIVLIKHRPSVPPDWGWMWIMHLTLIIVIFLSLNIINAYHTMVVWFVFAGNEIFHQNIKKLKKAALNTSRINS